MARVLRRAAARVIAGEWSVQSTSPRPVRAAHAAVARPGPNPSSTIRSIGRISSGSTREVALLEWATVWHAGAELARAAGSLRDVRRALDQSG